MSLIFFFFKWWFLLSCKGRSIINNISRTVNLLIGDGCGGENERNQIAISKINILCNISNLRCSDPLALRIMTLELKVVDIFCVSWNCKKLSSHIFRLCFAIINTAKSFKSLFPLTINDFTKRTLRKKLNIVNYSKPLGLGKNWEYWRAYYTFLALYIPGICFFSVCEGLN